MEGNSHLARRFSKMADWVESLRDELPPDEVVLLITHGDMQNRLLNVLLARRMGVPDFKAGGEESTYVGWHPGSNTSATLLTMNPPGAVYRGAPAAEFDISFSHRLDHLGPETEPDTLQRGYKSLGLLEPTAEDRADGPVGYWGLRIAPKL